MINTDAKKINRDTHGPKTKGRNKKKLFYNKEQVL